MKCKYFKFIFSFDISHLILKTDDSRISFGILFSLKTLQMQIKSKKKPQNLFLSNAQALCELAELKKKNLEK